MSCQWCYSSRSDDEEDPLDSWAVFNSIALRMGWPVCTFCLWKAADLQLKTRALTATASSPLDTFIYIHYVTSYSQVHLGAVTASGKTFEQVCL